MLSPQLLRVSLEYVILFMKKHTPLINAECQRQKAPTKKSEFRRDPCTELPYEGKNAT